MAIRKKPLVETDKPHCGRCHYYEKLEDTHGYCRRYPPTGDDWQVTLAEDWCGEYLTAALEKTLSITEAGRRYYGLSINGSYLAAKRGDFPLIQVGKQKRVPVSAMELRMAHERGELELEKEE